MVKYCSKCGEKIEPHWNLCPKCGRKIGKEDKIDIKDSVINRSQIISQHIEKMIVQGEVAPSHGGKPLEGEPLCPEPAFEKFLSEEEKKKALNASPQEKREWAEVILERLMGKYNLPFMRSEFARAYHKVIFQKELILGRKLTENERKDAADKAVKEYLG